MLEGEPEAAREHLATALKLAQTANNPVAETAARRQLAWSLIDDDPRAAAAAFRDALLLIIDRGLLHLAPITCKQAAVVLADAGADDVAARILGRLGPYPADTHAEAIRQRRTRSGLERRLGSRYGQLADDGASISMSELVHAVLDACSVE